MARRHSSPSLDRETLEAIVTHVRSGVHLEAAAQAVGVRPSTFHSWQAKGRRYRDALQDPDHDPYEPCPTCGQTGDDPCMTSSGNLASRRHAPRVAPPELPEKAGLYVQLVEQVERAHAQAIVQTISQIRSAGEEDWKAAAWYAARTHPEHYARRTEITGAEGGPVRIADVDDRLGELLDDDEDEEDEDG